jgi:hypothetical protein
VIYTRLNFFGRVTSSAGSATLFSAKLLLNSTFQPGFQFSSSRCDRVFRPQTTLRTAPGWITLARIFSANSLHQRGRQRFSSANLCIKFDFSAEFQTFSSGSKTGSTLNAANTKPHGITAALQLSPTSGTPPPASSTKNQPERAAFSRCLHRPRPSLDQPNQGIDRHTHRPQQSPQEVQNGTLSQRAASKVLRFSVIFILLHSYRRIHTFASIFR